MDTTTAPTTAPTAVPTAAAGPPALAAALDSPVLAPLDELGVISCSGADAANFLHSQLTADVNDLHEDRLALAGFCTAKGRLLATFRIWRDAQAIYLLLPRELLAGVLKRLSMFVLRAKAKLGDASADWSAFAVFGRGAEAKLRAAFGAAPASPGELLSVDGARLARLPASARIAERFLLLVPAATDIRQRLEGIDIVASEAFWWSEIDAAMPTVFAVTQEKFVPQMINFEVLGGVNFRKGCYPGQEVVARSQYLGKLRRRMQRAHAAALAQAGDDVYAADSAEPIGTVVMAANSPDGGTDLLFECPVERLQAGLRLQSAAGPALELRELPYELVDVTA